MSQNLTSFQLRKILTELKDDEYKKVGGRLKCMMI